MGEMRWVALHLGNTGQCLPRDNTATSSEVWYHLPILAHYMVCRRNLSVPAAKLKPGKNTSKSDKMKM